MSKEYKIKDYTENEDTNQESKTSLLKTSKYSSAQDFEGENETTFGSNAFEIKAKVIKFNGVYIFSGTGTPLNVVIAPVGSLFLRKDGGTNTTLYIKETLTTSAGWVAK